MNDDRLPPQSREAEAAVLGAMMMSGSAIDAVQDVGLTPVDFYNPAHRAVFEAIRTLESAQAPQIDELTTTAKMRELGTLDEVGGQAFVYSLAQRVPAVANTRSYATEVANQSQRRHIIKAAEQAMSMAYNHETDVAGLGDQACSLFADAVLDRTSSDLISLEDALPQLMTQLHERYNATSELIGITTGFSELDEVLGGWQAGLHILGARPAMGKSGMAVNWVVAAAKRGANVLLANLEMTNVATVGRIVSGESMVDGQRLTIQKPHKDDFVDIEHAIAQLKSSGTANRVWFEDSSRLSPGQLRAKARRKHRMLRRSKQRLDLIVVDYGQLMDAAGSPRDSNRTQQVGFIFRQLKLLSRELSIPVIALAQLSRGAADPLKIRRPTLTDLRDSGEIEQHADTVMLLHRPEYYNPDDPSLGGLAELIIAKNRNGPIKTVHLGFRARYTQFVSLKNVHTTGPRIPGAGAVEVV